MKDCDRFNTCSANICPLDDDWSKRKHLREGRICYYLIEAQKCGAKANFESGGRGELYELMEMATPSIISKFSSIRHALARAKKSGSRMHRVPGWVKHES